MNTDARRRAAARLSHATACLKKDGLWVPIVSILKHGRIDTDATVQHIINLERNGATGVVINGTTGRANDLTIQDKLSIIKAVAAARNQLDPGFVIITGIASANPLEAERIIMTAGYHEFHGVLALPPPNLGEHSKYLTFAAARCQEIGIGMLLYNHPTLNPGYTIHPATLGYLMGLFRSVVGVKCSAKDEEILKSWQPKCKEISGQTPIVACGEDYLAAYALKECGATALIAGTANTYDGLFHALCILRRSRPNPKKGGIIQFEKAARAQLRFNEEIKMHVDSGDFRASVEKHRI